MEKIAKYGEPSKKTFVINKSANNFKELPAFLNIFFYIYVYTTVFLIIIFIYNTFVLCKYKKKKNFSNFLCVVKPH